MDQDCQRIEPPLLFVPGGIENKDRCADMEKDCYASVYQSKTEHSGTEACDLVDYSCDLRCNFRCECI